MPTFESARDLLAELDSDVFPSPHCFLAWLRDLWEAERARELREGLESFPQAGYSHKGMALEAWSRLLWGILPAALGLIRSGLPLPNWMEEALADASRRVLQGCDPTHPGFFGEATASDQRFVEMAVLGLAVELFPDRFASHLDDKQRTNMVHWLGQIHRNPYPDNNWRFFRCFVSLGLLRLTESFAVDHAEERAAWSRSLDEDLLHLEGLYLGGGWYADGPGGKRDYYNPFGFHTYALLLHALRPDLPVLKRFRDRVLEHLPTYAALFDHSGAAIAFGRSMTYRFAQGSLLSACIGFGMYREECPHVPAWCTLSWLKTMLFRHLRYWFHQRMFTEDGRLSVGYAYPNTRMSEQYNAYGSPGWGLKTLWFLSLPSSHPFWSTPLCREPDLPDGFRVEPCLPGILVRAEQGSHAFLLNGGQLTPENATSWAPRHAEAKYAKFVYSSRFGFAVSSSSFGLGYTAVDSTLAVSMDGEHWQTRARCDGVAANNRQVEARWRPFAPDELSIFTRLLPFGSGHVRVHDIASRVRFRMVDGGFACPVDFGTPDGTERETLFEENRLTLQHGELSSSIFLLSFPEKSDGPKLEPHTLDPGSHLLFPHARVPILTAWIEPGRHRVVTAFHGGSQAGLEAFSHKLGELVLNIDLPS